MPAKPDFSDMHCSIARSLSVIGESWTLLILRDLLQGLSRFDELQKNLGIATNVLTSRLKRLTEEGLVEQRRYQQHPPRYEYLLTDQGRDLGPVLVNLVQWGNKYLSGSKRPPQTIVHKACGHVTSVHLTCSHCHEAVERQGLTIVPSGKLKTARG